MITMVRLCALAAVLLSLLSTINGQLRYNDSDVYDGACSYPAPESLPLYFLTAFTNGYYFPMTSKSHFRFQYELAYGTPAQSEGDIGAMKPRGNAAQLDNILQGYLEHTDFENPVASYDLACTPTNLVFTNMTCTVARSSRGEEAVGFGGPAVVSILWHDNRAWLEWLCIQGQQMFRILSKDSVLTSGQNQAMTSILINLGFHESNFQHMNY